MAEFVNTTAVLTKMGNDTIRYAQLELGTVRTYETSRVKWKKSGKNWQVAGVQKIKRRGRINASGSLSKSFSYDMIFTANPTLKILSSVDYADEVNDGTLPRGKQPPPLAMLRYTFTKPLKPRAFVNGKLGGFTKDTAKARGAMSFMIGRKIKHLGTQPTHYMDKALLRATEEYVDELTVAIVQDMTDLIEDF